MVKAFLTILVFVLMLALRSACVQAQADFNLLPASKPHAGQITLDSSAGGQAISVAVATPSPGWFVVSLHLKASCSNTVPLMVGASTLNYTSAKGVTLNACETLDADVDNLADVFVDAGTTAGQVVEYLAVKKR